MSKIQKPNITEFGENGILLTWPQEISDVVHNRVVAYQNWIDFHFIDSIQDSNIGYQSLLVIVKQSKDLKQMVNAFKLLDVMENSKNKEINYVYTIPVCYDIKFGIDLEHLAKQNHLTTEEVIAAHTNERYKVCFTGFLPGFLYLSGLNEVLHTPRHSTPRLMVPKGSVAIGGGQTGIYPHDSPGGWHIIGQTPLELFNARTNPPSIFKPGDYIQFYSVSAKDFTGIKSAILSNLFILKKEVLND